MENPPPPPMTAGLCLALVAVLFGFALGGAFGANEEALVAPLKASGAAALQDVYRGDAAKMEAVVEKSERYLVRAHLHGGAMGTAALASIAALLALGLRGPGAQASSAAFGAGALLYSLFWLLAAYRAPALGGTGAAKESLKWLAVPGAGLAVLGALGTLASVLSSLRRR